MTEERKKEIQGISENLLRKYSFGYEPIDIIKLANSIGFSVYHLANAASFDGVIVVNKTGKPIDDTIKESKIIGFKSEIEKNQNRFIIAHELGHFYLHSEKSKDPLFIYKYHEKNSNSDIESEAEADFFAANLLVPEDGLKSFMSKYKETKDNLFAINEASLYYQVSIECIKKRLNEIKYHA